MNKLIYKHKQLLQMDGKEIEVLYGDNEHRQLSRSIEVQRLILPNIDRIVVSVSCDMVHIDFINGNGDLSARKMVKVNSYLEIKDGSFGEYMFIESGVK